MKRVVITGMGAVTPLGNDLKSYWSSLCNGTSGAGIISRFDVSDFKTTFACEVKNYDSENYFPRKEGRKLDRFAQYGLIAANEAVTDAGITTIRPERSGVIFSSGIGGFETFEKEVEQNASEQFKRYSPFFITKIIANGLSGMISINHGFRGVNYAPVTACASSTQSIIQAFNYIRLGKADIIIAGGAEAPVTPAAVAGFNAMKAMSTNNENFATASRPFDSSRDGFVLGEGAGALVIESLEHARQRDARIYAEVAGGGEFADAYHITGTHPEGEGAYLAMAAAMQEAQIQPGQLDYLNAHATSTGVGDISELIAIQRLFRDYSSLHISATKSMTGHLLGAAGAIEAIAACMSICTGKIPPTINTLSIDDAVPDGMQLTLGEAVEKKVRYALSNSFGFGGHCSALVLKSFPDE